MRLDARKGDIDWDIYDAKTCSTPTMVVFNEVADNSDTELIKAAPISESEAACANV
jgi:hypothetical protein